MNAAEIVDSAPAWPKVYDDLNTWARKREELYAAKDLADSQHRTAKNAIEAANRQHYSASIDVARADASTGRPDPGLPWFAGQKVHDVAAEAAVTAAAAQLQQLREEETRLQIVLANAVDALARHDAAKPVATVQDIGDVRCVLASLRDQRDQIGTRLAEIYAVGDPEEDDQVRAVRERYASAIAADTLEGEADDSPETIELARQLDEALAAARQRAERAQARQTGLRESLRLIEADLAEAEAVQHQLLESHALGLHRKALAVLQRATTDPKLQTALGDLVVADELLHLVGHRRRCSHQPGLKIEVQGTIEGFTNVRLQPDGWAARAEKLVAASGLRD